MDFFKKNWGLLLAFLLFLVGTGFLSWLLVGAMRQAAANKAKLGKELEFFSRVQQQNIKLTNDNRDTALQNAAHAKERFERLRNQLHSKFRIEVRFPSDPYRAIQQLRSRVDGLRTRLQEAQVALGQQGQHLSFEDYTQNNVMPRRDDMPELFRQFSIVEEIVGQAIQSRVAMIDTIARPMMLSREEEDLYHITPVEVSVTGTAESVSQFLNSFHTTAKFLFFVRKVELSSPDQVTGGAIGGASGRGMGTGMDGMDGGMPAAPRRSRRGGMAPGMGGMEAGMGMDQGMGMGMDQGMGMGMGMEGGMGMGGTAAAAMPVLLTREQLRAFQDRYITAVVRLDLVEFTTPE